jgi:hypothetical protein
MPGRQGLGVPAASTFEGDGAPAVHEHPVVNVSSQGPRKDRDLEVPAPALQVLDIVAMADPQHVLVNDRTVVQVGGDVVSRDTDELHATFVGLVVGPGTLKGREERVVNVDDLFSPLFTELGGKHLHIASEHHEVDALRT